MRGKGQILRVADDVVEPDEHRELEEQREARLERIDVVLLPNLHDLLVHLHRVVRVLLAEGFDLRLEELHLLLALERVLRGDEEDELHGEREEDDRESQIMARDDRPHEHEEVQERAGDERGIGFAEHSLRRHLGLHGVRHGARRALGRDREFIQAILGECDVFPRCERDLGRLPCRDGGGLHAFHHRLAGVHRGAGAGLRRAEESDRDGRVRTRDGECQCGLGVVLHHEDRILARDERGVLHGDLDRCDHDRFCIAEEPREEVLRREEDQKSDDREIEDPGRGLGGGGCAHGRRWEKNATTSR